MNELGDSDHRQRKRLLSDVCFLCDLSADAELVFSPQRLLGNYLAAQPLGVCGTIFSTRAAPCGHFVCFPSKGMFSSVPLLPGHPDTRLRLSLMYHPFSERCRCWSSPASMASGVLRLTASLETSLLLLSPNPRVGNNTTEAGRKTADCPKKCRGSRVTGICQSPRKLGP